MKTLTVGIIGCGGRGTAHALGYSLSEEVRVVACADVHEPAARRLAETFDVEQVYTDYHDMLRREKLDIVSMCLWPDLHAEAVLACLEAPYRPRLINAEKPMAPVYGDCLRMHEAAAAAGVMLTFSHQRRFGPHFRRARDLIRDGAIGTLQRLEMDCSNLLDWGTHWFDMMLFYNEDLDPSWVMGQIACVADNLVFGARIETAGLAYIKWPNDVTGLLTTGQGTAAPATIRVLGSEGRLDVDHRTVRLLRAGHPWENVSVEAEPLPGGDTSRHILDSIDCLRTGRESICSSNHALRATQLIFATYESARRRTRVVLPLKSTDNALLTMLENGEISIPDWPAFLTEEEEENGFSLLFNGRDLAGWQAAPTDAWECRGGILRGGYARPGWLQYETALPRLTLMFEFRLGTRAEAALLLRTDDNGKGLEIPLKEDRWVPRTLTSTGALAGYIAPAGDPNTGASRWNWMEVTLDSTTLHVVINDVELLECNLNDLPPDANGPGESIALRIDGGHVDLRNIIAKPLS